MKIIFVILFAFVFNLSYAEESLKDIPKESPDLLEEMVTKRFPLLKSDIQEKIQKREKKLKKYQANLSNSRTEKETLHWSKKVKKTESIIELLNDSLIVVEVADCQSTKK